MFNWFFNKQQKEKPIMVEEQYFIPTQDFWSTELKTQYCKDLLYRTPKDRMAPLAALLIKWRAEGKVMIVRKPNAAIIGGT